MSQPPAVTLLLFDLVGAFVEPLVMSGLKCPRAEIGSGSIQAGLYLPDAQNGGYQAARPDRSFVIYGLEQEGRRYFGQWVPVREGRKVVNTI